MDSPLFSVRMRASCRGQHVSGAERIVAQAEVSQVLAELAERALNSTNGGTDDIYCSVERIDAASVSHARLPDLSTCQVKSFHAGRQLAVQLLKQAGVGEAMATHAVQLLAVGPGPEGSVMRGAVILDVNTGQRLEGDPQRGLRVSRMDMTPLCRTSLDQQLARHGLAHRRVREALTLAGKVLSAPGIVAELCWSDDPDYVAGYVAAPQFGYRRVTEMKAKGDPLGGRIFFVDLASVTLADFISYLEQQPILFDQVGAVSQPETWNSDE